jgi:ribosomal protein L6P/L9E
MGFKMIWHLQGIILKLGYSHRVLFIRQKEITFTYLNRHLLKIEGRSLSLIKSSLFRFMLMKLKSVYKKKGIFLKGSILNIKITSKKSKF